MRTKFHKYPKIVNADRNKYLDIVKELGYDSKSIEYYVTEKVHGANFAIYISNAETRFASRNRLLGKESFMGSESISLQLQLFSIEISSLINFDRDCRASLIVIHGELAGGFYPDDSHWTLAAKRLLTKRVQKGVHYHPANFFYVFDISVDGEFLPMHELEMLGSLINRNFNHIIFAKKLFKGTLEECLRYPNEFQTTIPDYFGLPAIKDNICEGVVIKPCNANLRFPNGERVIFKNKNENFSEKSKKKKHSAIELSEEDAAQYAEAVQYVTKNKLSNVLSHMTQDEKNVFGKIIEAMRQDILNEMEYPKQATFSKAVKKRLSKDIAKLISSHYRNILDGESI